MLTSELLVIVICQMCGFCKHLEPCSHNKPGRLVGRLRKMLSNPVIWAIATVKLIANES